MLSEKTINPCPFCGKKIMLGRNQIGIYRVRHAEKTDCELGRVAIYAETDEEATELWNMTKAPELWNITTIFASSTPRKQTVDSDIT